MKKHILLFFVGILCSIGAMAAISTTTNMNPFAYNLKAEPSKDNKTITVSYCLNANARTVTIVFLDGNNIIASIPSTGITKTTSDTPHNFDISTEGFGMGKTISWRIDVQGHGRNAHEIYSSTYAFDLPSSVDIVKDPTSHNYGKVIVVEGSHAGYQQEGLHSKEKGAGLYVFYPDMTPIKDKNNHYGFNGGTTTWGQGATSAKIFANTSYAPRRVRVSEDGRIFVSSMYQHEGTKQAYIHGDILWEVDENFSKWTTVMGEGVGGAKYDITAIKADGKTYYNNQLQTSDGAYIAAPNAGLDVRGSGEHLKLLLLSCDYRAFASNYQGFSLNEYNLGKKTTWSTAPNKSFNITTKDKQVFATAMASNVLYDKDGGIWCASFRSTSSYTQPGLVHMTESGVEKCRILRSGTQNAGLRFNKDFTRAIMGTSGSIGMLYDYDPTSAANTSEVGYFFNEDPIDMSAVGPYLNDFAWDNANNIYAVGQKTYDGNDGDGHIAVYCLKYDQNDVFTTPGPKTITLTETICWHPYPEGHQVTNEDLWEAFQRDYNDWYRFHENAEQKISENQAYQPITSAYGFTYPSDKIDENTYKYRDGLVSDLLTDEKSKWKWLGDYIKDIANPAIPTNEVLGKAFMNAYNAYYGTSINVNSYTYATISNFLWNGKSNHSVDITSMMTNDNSTWKWLGDYIQSVSTNAGLTITSEVYWRYSITAFFNCGVEGTYNKSFTEAGKPENWGPYYQTIDGISQVDTEFEWRKEVHAFFNQTNKCGYYDVNGTWRSDNTGDYTTAGNSDQANDGANGWWNEWWDATFKPTMGAYPTDSLPTIRRKGYVLSGWYYGDNDGYSLDDRENTKGQTRGGCLWARWLETCLYEGYITGTSDNSAAMEEMGQQINRNIELMNIIQGKSDYPMDIERKLQGGVYNTFAIPFALSKQVNALNYIGKIVDVNNENTQLLTGNTSILRYQGSSIIENGEGEYILQLNFAEWEGTDANDYIAASTPILIKPENNITQRMHTQWNPYISTAYHPVSDSYVEFTPVLAPTEILGGDGTNNLILVADNRLAQLTAPGIMKGLRGYFNGSGIPANLNPAKAIVKITDKNGVVTYLDNIENPQQEASAIKILHNGQIYILRGDEVYTITGNRVR